jgi:uncharacterized membrane protein YcaP (DUF421 family)
MAVAFIRTIIIYLVIIISLRLMGKRQVGEMQPSELVVTILISELAAMPLERPGINLMSSLVPIMTLLSLEIILSVLSMKNNKVRAVTTGRPSVLISDGVVNQKEMEDMRVSIEDLAEEVRLAGYMNVSDVSHAVLETSGKFSIFPTQAQMPLTASMMKISPGDDGIPTVIISDGRLFRSNMDKRGLTTKWLKSTLKSNGADSPDEIFYMTVDKNNSVSIIKKQI